MNQSHNNNYEFVISSAAADEQRFFGAVLCLVLLGAELCAAVLAMPKLCGEAWAVTCLYLTSDEMMVTMK